MLTPADFRIPKGTVERIFFPSDSDAALNTRLQGYITEGGTVLGGSGGDPALSNYVYWRVYDAVYKRLLMRPAKISKQAEGSTEYLLTQIDQIKTIADAYEAAYLAALPTPSAPQTSPPTQTIFATFTS